MTSGQIVGKMDTQKQLNVPLHFSRMERISSSDDSTCASETAREGVSGLFCPCQEKFHTAVLQGVRNISDPRKIRL